MLPAHNLWVARQVVLANSHHRRHLVVAVVAGLVVGLVAEAVGETATCKQTTNSLPLWTHPMTTTLKILPCRTLEANKRLGRV
jgi:hypothetical protein